VATLLNATLRHLRDGSHFKVISTEPTDIYVLKREGADEPAFRETLAGLRRDYVVFSLGRTPTEDEVRAAQARAGTRALAQVIQRRHEAQEATRALLDDVGIDGGSVDFDPPDAASPIAHEAMATAGRASTRRTPSHERHHHS
jgi:hypothetical protein